MKIAYYFMAITLLAVPAGVSAQAIEGAPDGYSLVWSDEFDGTVLNEQTWNIEVSGTGGGNQELQYYKRENVAVENGNLVLTARREAYAGKQFTSGRINSKNNTAFQHGIIQARVKMPKTANGLWPAYWMMGNDMDRYGWPRCGEIDIVEMGHFNAISGQYAGMQDRYFAGTTHYGPDASNENHQQYSQDFLADETNPVLNDEYHIFTVEWDDNYLYMYYDLEGYTNARKRRARYFTQEIAYSDAVLAPGHYFQKPFFLLFNLAVGGTYTNIYDPSLITALPNSGDEAKMYVDWVRVYQKDDDQNAKYLYKDEQGNTVTNIEEEPEPQPQEDTKTQLSGFASEALDENGTSTFDFADGYDYVLISTSGGVTGNCLKQSNVLKDYNVDEENNFLYVWDGTYSALGRSGKENSFGWAEGYTTYYVGTSGWSGLGFASPKGKGKDLSMIDDDYWLHFALKGNDVETHTPQTVLVGAASFIIGDTDGKLASIGDYKRDGEWYYFDIPVKAIRQFADPVYGTEYSNDRSYTYDEKNYEGNVVAFMSGGVNDAELTFDNIFFYKSHSKSVPTYTDDSADLGKYGYKSLDDDGNSVFDYSLCEHVIPFALTEDLWKGWTGDGQYPEGSVVTAEHDYTMQGGHNNFFVWGDPQTFKTRSEDFTAGNSTGVYTGPITSFASVIGQGWNGMGYASIAGMGFNPAPKDLSMIDDTYWLHFSLRSDAAVSHVPVTLRLGSKDVDATITLGSYTNGRQIVGDFNRDGEWYSFDIPVSELKQYGKLWSDAPNHGGIESFTDYVLCLYTAPTYYSGSYFSFDNVFFYQKKGEDAPLVQELGPYTTKSLDEQGNSYFDFEKKEYIPVIVGAQERLAMGDDNIVADFSINDQKTHFYYWEGTYAAAPTEGKNSFGFDEGWTAISVTDKGWTGAGIINDDGYDVSMLDGSWYLHFAVKGDEATGSDLHLILGKTHFTIGHDKFVNASGEVYPVLGDFRRDGEWYSYDIPMTEFYRINSSLFREGGSCPAAFKDNLFVFSNGGRQGDLLQVDNLFFWKEKDEATGVQLVNTGDDTAHAAVMLRGIYDLTGRLVSAGTESMRTGSLRPGIYIVADDATVRKIWIK